MKLIQDVNDLSKVAGGECSTCQEALIEYAIKWSIMDITQYCTQAQFTAYALGMIELMYTNPTIDVAAEIAMIQGLDI